MLRDDDRRHPHPVGHRAGRPARRRATACRWSTTSCGGWRRRGWPRRSRGRRCRPRPWSTRRTCGWSDGDEAQHWNSRGHFFAAAAEAMRRILVDQARRKQADKRGGGRLRVDLAGRPRRRRGPCRRPAGPGRGADPARAATTREAAQLVKLRYFAGLTHRGGGRRPWASAAAPPTGTGRYARAWLFRRNVAGEVGLRTVRDDFFIRLQL